MRLTYMPPIENRNGQFTKMRMHLRPKLPIPVNYATAAIPTYAPFGTEYTPEQTMKIVGGRCIVLPQSVANMPKFSFESLLKPPDPSVSPTKPIQHLHEAESARLQHHATGRYETTYRTQFAPRTTRQPEQFSQPTRQFQNVFSPYPVLPKISPDHNPTPTSDRKSVIDTPVPQKPTPQPPPQQQQQQPVLNNEDTYLPREPILLTDYEEERLAEQIRAQLGGEAAVEKLKILYQELAAYDPNTTCYIHYNAVRSIAYQIGLYMADDTFRFAMSKFVSADQPRGLINYEDMIRYFARCISSLTPNQYESRQYHLGKHWSQHSNYYDTNIGNHPQQQQQQMVSNGSNFSKSNDKFDPDESQIRLLLKQNLKQFEHDGTIDFDKLTRELSSVDRSQSGILNRQQIEEVIYKVRIPLQRSLTYQILERHCRAYPKLYNWRAFVQYLKERTFDIQQIQDRSSPIFSQYTRSRNQWLDDLQKEFNERDRLRLIERFMSNIANNEGVRLESTYPNAWFTRFLRLANAMYSHRTDSNVMQDYLLPREEARRLLQAYNQVWDLQINENKILRAFDAYSRNGYVVINEVLKELAK
ncbi:unnamed protein product [Adineta steineri]|uniref:EF-hand domain-containing protein n=1 Tax=Adineta steineri TaxID=433720 RepID=A0A815IPD4_9BILA|nr:unnamed protein product [Adineta steineri]CAF1368662.1 unnamed protein product [Adineta steineri]